MRCLGWGLGERDWEDGSTPLAAGGGLISLYSCVLVSLSVFLSSSSQASTLMQFYFALEFLFRRSRCLQKPGKIFLSTLVSVRDVGRGEWLKELGGGGEES